MTNPEEIALGNVNVYGENKFDIASGYTDLGVSLTAPSITGSQIADVANQRLSSGLNTNTNMGKFGDAISATAKNDPGAFGQIAEGLTGIGLGIVGGRARREEQRAARNELNLMRERYETFEFKDTTAGMTNPFEDLTVNQQQAQFQAQQQQQALAGTLGQLQGAAGSSGIAALAQTLAQQSAANLQQSAASIGLQEQQNQLQRARGQQVLEQLRAREAARIQGAEFGRTEQLYNISAARKVAADEARRQATKNLVGGVANTITGAGRIVAAAATGGASEAVT